MMIKVGVATLIDVISVDMFSANYSEWTVVLNKEYEYDWIQEEYDWIQNEYDWIQN